MTLIVQTLSERIFEIVRDRIVDGTLTSEGPMNQGALATELGVSKVPLREALAKLEQDGLLTSQPNRGWFVRPMSADQAGEIYNLRLAIEPAAAAFSCGCANESDKREATQAWNELGSIPGHDLKGVAVRHRAFHISLVRPGGRLLTTNLVERLAVLAERYVVAHLEPAGRGDRAHSEHRLLLDAWLAGDQKQVHQLLTMHLTTTLADLAAHLASSVK